LIIKLNRKPLSADKKRRIAVKTINTINKKYLKPKTKVITKLHFSGDYIVIFSKEGKY
ncbi:hypothetical protein GE21DRAFT_1222732, partial [Neurospora crassa]